jgi:8-oxo-dGTP pyrophosphatase MutT (NUDIX family)
MSEENDSSLYRTALRETYEEVGIRERDFVYRGQLKTEVTRYGTGAVPFVVELRQKPDLVLSEHEIESARWVPMSLFVRDQRVRTDVFRSTQGESWAPVYHYEDYEIWGLTARVISSFVNRFYGRQVNRKHGDAEERVYKLKR